MPGAGLAASPPNLTTLIASVDATAIGREIHDRIRRLYPICRSITGSGLRESLGIIGEEIQIAAEEIPTGTAVFDWTVPKEWNIRDAYIANTRGDRIVDFHDSNLHVVNYSVPVRARMPLEALRPHLHSLPEHPDWIPYKTSYYAETWGFCLTDRQLRSLPDEEYDVCIDASLEDGHMTLGECVLRGREAGEVLVSCHLCHPSLCNDNLSGVSIGVTLARLLTTVDHRYTYRFLFKPGTIGAIAWLARHEEAAARVQHGLVLACAGDSGAITYKRSRRGNADIDRAMEHVLRHAGAGFTIAPFSPFGYDERQYCSPGFDLPVGVLSRTPHGRFPQYHTSADNLDFVEPDALADTLLTCLRVVEILEGDGVFHNLNPKCEPQLGKRGLTARAAGPQGNGDVDAALLWVLNLSDGEHTLLDIAERADMRFSSVRAAADLLMHHGLLRPDDPHQ